MAHIVYNFPHVAIHLVHCVTSCIIHNMVNLSFNHQIYEINDKCTIMGQFETFKTLRISVNVMKSIYSPNLKISKKLAVFNTYYFNIVAIRIYKFSLLFKSSNEKLGIWCIEDP